MQEQYDKHPIFILKDVKYQELRAMMDYMYRGEVNISQDQLAALLKAAESLQIKGLSDNRSGSCPAPKSELQSQILQHHPHQQQQHMHSMQQQQHHHHQQQQQHHHHHHPQQQQTQSQQHLRSGGKMISGGVSGTGSYGLEQTKRPRISGLVGVGGIGAGGTATALLEGADLGSREGSSSPSRRRRKGRRKSIDNNMTGNKNMKLFNLLNFRKEI